MAEQSNQLRVRAAALLWDRRHARAISISPGVISTPMGNAELEGPVREMMRELIAANGTGRLDTPSDIAAAVQVLVGPEAPFITVTEPFGRRRRASAILAGPSL